MRKQIGKSGKFPKVSTLSRFREFISGFPDFRISGFSKPRKGFTLIELLTTTAIIGLLATMSTVGYGYVRTKARDTKRLADIRTIRNGIELYFEFNDRYPSAPPSGVILGSDDAKTISSAGITSFDKAREPIFLQNVPANILPGGLPYYYNTRNADGSYCSEACGGFEVVFGLETAVGDYVPGPHKLTETQVEGPEGGRKDFRLPTGLAAYVPTSEDVRAALGTVAEVNEIARQQVDVPVVQATNRFVAAPAAVAVAAANAAAALSTAVPAANAGQFLALLLSQPILFFTRKRRHGWGVVYDANTKVPVDLASVRLIDPRTNRPVATKVTDKDGRYAFNPPRGSYRMEVAKPGYRFPVDALRDAKEDGRFLDIYHGTLVKVETDGQTVTANIPIEPAGAPDDVTRITAVESKKGLRKVLALTGPILGGVVLFVTPSTLMLLIFMVHLLVYFGFKRLTEAPEPKSQGVVFDIDNKDPIDKAVVRVFSLPYNKVLETRVTDSRGRYSFYVGNGKYYLTVMKQGYQKTETNEIDFTQLEKPTFIASDLPMRKAPNPEPQTPS